MGENHLDFLVGRNHQLVKSVLVGFGAFFDGCYIDFRNRLATFVENNPFDSGILSKTKLETKKQKKK